MPRGIYTAGIRFRLCQDCGEMILPGQQYRRVGKKSVHINPLCIKAQSEVCHEPTELDVWWQPQEIPRSQNRCLRTYFREHAAKEYVCHRCHYDPAVDLIPDLETIFAGDAYEAQVWVIRGKIEIRRFHQQCPYPPDPEWDDREKKRDSDEPSRLHLPLAA